jgi:hypothetical protein
MVIREMASGIPRNIKLILVSRATTYTKGMRSTNPTSKNTGMPAIAPTIAMTQWARVDPKLSRRVLASRSAPPDSSSILPKMPPSPMMAIRNPRVPPIPDSSDLTI